MADAGNGSDVDVAVLKRTQQMLGKYVKKPALSEKLLRKPPFRFLHDVINVVIKDTGCFQGLYTADELNFENIKDREDKMNFLKKMIDVIKLTTGNEELNVRASKIVCGHEPERTNELLQQMAVVIEQQLDWQSAVQQLKENNNNNNNSVPATKAPKKSVTPTATATDADKAKEKAKAKAKDAGGKSVGGTRKEEVKEKKPKRTTPTSNDKTVKPTKERAVKEKSSKSNAGGTSGSGVGATKDKADAAATAKESKIDADKKKRKTSKTTKDTKEKTPSPVAGVVEDGEQIRQSPVKAIAPQTMSSDATNAPKPSVDSHNSPVASNKIEVPSTILENGDLPTTDEVETKIKRKSSSGKRRSSAGSRRSSANKAATTTTPQEEPMAQASPQPLARQPSPPKAETPPQPQPSAPTPTQTSAPPQPVQPQPLPVAVTSKPATNDAPVNATTTAANKSSNNSSSSITTNNGHRNSPMQRESTFTRDDEIIANAPPRTTTLRPPSARPASARPGAPRKRNRNVEIVLQPNDEVKTDAGIKVKLESFGDFGDDDENLVIIDDNDADADGVGDGNNNSNQQNAQNYDLSGENGGIAADGDMQQQGHLVQQILETHKELVHQPMTNNGIDKQQERNTGSGNSGGMQQMSNLRDVIQNLTKAINPFGKLIDFLPEDIDAMQLEMSMWRDAYQQASIELKRERSLTESVTEPLKQQLTQIEANITEYVQLLDASRLKVLQNSEKIMKMFTE